ncbi:MAG: prolyl aminopeptidase [Alphaproteobacteria bacterium]
MRKTKEGYLKVDEIHKIHWVEYGNPEGKPVLIFHGGPGSQFKKRHASNKDKYRIIGFDQRGCGKSLPSGEIKNNTTQDLLRDADKLLDYLKIDKINLFGSSWGSTMALLYAEHNPLRVASVFVSAVFLARKKDDEWLYNGVKSIYPDYYEKFIKNIPENKRDNIAEYLLEIIEKGSFQKQGETALAISNYEYSLMLVNPEKEEFSNEASEEDIAASKIFLHYSKNDYFLSEKEQILNNLHKIKDIPITIVHGRFDMCCPLEGAYSLHKGLKKSKLIISDGENHISPKNSKILNEEINKNL